MIYKYSRKQILAFFPSYQSKADMLNDLLATKEQGECEHIFCSTAKNGDVTCDDCHKLLQNIDNPHPTHH